MGLLNKLLGTDQVSPTGKNKINDIITKLLGGYAGQVLVSQGDGATDPQWQDIPNPFYADTAGNANTADSATTAGTSEKLTDGTNTIGIKVVPIGVWNMDADDSINAAHGLNAEKIVAITGIIRNDANTLRYVINQRGVSSLGTGITSFDATNVTMYRASYNPAVAEIFDSTDFDSILFSRGYLVITYIV